MVTRCLLPLSTGSARAHARGEILERALGRALGTAVQVSVAESYAALGDAMASGTTELAWVPAAVLAELEEAHSGAVRRAYKTVRNGRSTYRSAIIVRASAPYERVEDLAGARAAWADPMSLGGCQLAMAHLRRHGVELARSDYLGSHPSAVGAVLHREADVGAVSVADPEHVQSALSRNVGDSNARQLRVLAFTEPAPTDAFVIGDALPTHRVEELERLVLERGPTHSALCLAMEADGFERAALAEYRRLAKLVPASLRAAS